MKNEPQEEIKTDSEISIEPVYERIPGTPPEPPGQFPYTRGIQAGLYRKKLWTMRQYSGFSTASESNRRYHYLLGQGTTGLSVAFDLPTQMGYDSDHPLAEGEVGKAGVAIDSIHDMEVLFRGINPEQVSTSMTINSTAGILLALYIAHARRQGADLTKISGTIQNDLLKEYAARGTYIYPPRASMRIITDIFAYCSKEVPRWNTISISGYHIREAGATAAQELAFTLANGKAYVQAALEKGLDIDVFGKRLSFFFNAHNHLFQEVAKFRAARRMWAKMMKELGARDERAMMLRFHVQTGGSTLTARQPLNNIARVTLQALSAVLGGTQSLHTNGYDEALSLPTEEAAGIALRTQQILAYESGAADTTDPLGGSYFIESLTDSIEAEAGKYLAEIDRRGGAVQAIEAGYMQEEIARASYQYQESVERGERIIVGVNRFETEEPAFDKHFVVDDSIRQVQVDALRKMKQERDGSKVTEKIRRIEDAARGTENLMPAFVDAVESEVTLGEISDALRRVFGEYK